MHQDPVPAAVQTSHSDAVLRRLLGGMSVFTMVMTIPQVLTIWVARQAAGVSILSWSAYLASAILWFRHAEARQEYLFAMRMLDRIRHCCHCESDHLWIA
jgi:hypothetical protein